jgi:SAM-dependent methyltransferase
MNAKPDDKWDEWNSHGGPRYPHEKLVQFVFRNFPPEVRSAKRVLDLGCGSGVHAKFLGSEGFEVYGTDISKIGIEHTKALMSSNGLQGEFKDESVERIGYPSGFFDCVLSIGVLDCAGPGVFPSAIREIVRILKPGAIAMLIFASDADFRVCGPNQYGLHGFSDAEVSDARNTVEPQLEYFWMDRYVTTYQNKSIQQNDHLITIRRAI